MFTYQVWPRALRTESNSAPQFPADCELRFHLAPLQAFGMSGTGGRTVVRGSHVTGMLNLNSGTYSLESSAVLQPLQVVIESPSRRVSMDGNVLRVAERQSSLRSLDDLLNSVFFAMPTLLNIAFADPPYVDRVDVRIGDTDFRWELAEWIAEIGHTTQEEQEQAVVSAWQRMGVLSDDHNSRLIAGLHYFHVACRLDRESLTVGEFTAEVILNLAKTLEALFPPLNAEGTRDAIRGGLRALGFTDAEIERDFMPAIALRNEIDVAHVGLALFKLEHLKTIHRYTMRAETAFRRMLSRLLEQVETGEYALAPYVRCPVSGDALAVIDRIRQHETR